MPIRLRFLVAAWFFAIFAVAGAQELRWREKTLDSLFLRIVFPADGDTVDAGRVRFAASTDSAAQAWVNGRQRRVFPSGAFVGLVPLDPGPNLITFAVHLDSATSLEDTVRIYRRPPVQPFPPLPAAVDLGSIRPLQDLSLSAGDELHVEFRGSPGGRATFEVKKIAKRLPMVELPPEETGGAAGVYRGVFRLLAKEGYKPEKIKFEFRGKDNKKIKFESRGRLSLLSESMPTIAATADTNNILRVAPGGAILTELPMGIKLRVVGQEGEVARVRLASGVEAYAGLSTLKMLPPGSSEGRARVGGISASVATDWIRLRIAMNARVPFKIEQFTAPQALEVTFYRASQGSEWTTYPLNDSTLRIIRWRQETADRYVLRIELNQRQQWGFFGEYNGNNFILSVRKEPALAAPPASSLQGLRIAVDAGHGGKEPGSIGATGLLEKNVNLRYATMVADSLEARGALVTRIRPADSTMSLRSRMLKAREANARLFLWLHNNSIGGSSDPEMARGTSTYYTVPQGLEISRKVYPHLLNLGLAPFGNIASTYYVTRQTDMLIFLVEGAFLSNPEDEMLLLDEAFLAKLAGTVVAGVEDFLDGLRPQQLNDEIE